MSKETFELNPSPEFSQLLLKIESLNINRSLILQYIVDSYFESSIQSTFEDSELPIQPKQSCKDCRYQEICKNDPASEWVSDGVDCERYKRKFPNFPDHCNYMIKLWDELKVRCLNPKPPIIIPKDHIIANPQECWSCLKVRKSNKESKPIEKYKLKEPSFNTSNYRIQKITCPQTNRKVEIKYCEDSCKYGKSHANLCESYINYLPTNQPKVQEASKLIEIPDPKSIKESEHKEHQNLLKSAIYCPQVHKNVPLKTCIDCTDEFIKCSSIDKKLGNINYWKTHDLLPSYVPLLTKKENRDYFSD